MKFNSFEWDEINSNHIAQHAVTPEEAEEACYLATLILKSRMGRYYVLGKTFAGRYLTVIVQPKTSGVMRVITARNMSGTERRRLRR